MARTARRGTPLAVAIHGETAQWADEMHVAVSILDALRHYIWMNSDDGAKRRNRPEPVPRPGVVDPKRERYGNASMSLAETREWLESKNGKR